MTISGFAAYIKQAWKNKPDTSTPLSADRLLHIEDGIKGNSDAIAKSAAAVINQIVNDPNKIASMAALYAVKQSVDQLNTDFANTIFKKDGLAALQSNSGEVSTRIQVENHKDYAELFRSTDSWKTYKSLGILAIKDDLEKLDHTSTKSTNLGIDLHVYRMGGVVKALYAAGTHTTDWVANTAYGLGTLGGVYAPKISWSKRIIYKYVSGSPHYAVLAMDTNGVITIDPETVSYGGTLRIFETYF